MRYTIKGKRPGTTVHVNGVFFKDHGKGYPFNDAAVKELTKQGFKLEVVKQDAALVDDEKTVAEKIGDAEATARIAAAKMDAEKNESEVNRAPRKKKP